MKVPKYLGIRIFTPEDCKSLKYFVRNSLQRIEVHRNWNVFNFYQKQIAKTNPLELCISLIFISLTTRLSFKRLDHTIKLFSAPWDEDKRYEHFTQILILEYFHLCNLMSHNFYNSISISISIKKSKFDI